MVKEEKFDDNIIFIVKVVGTSSKTINIPDEVCKFCNINQGDLIKLKLLAKKSCGRKKNG